MPRIQARFIIVAGSLAFFAVSALGADKALPVPAGSTLRVRLDTLLSDKTNKTGDTFKGVVMEPIVVDGQEVIPKYSFVNGHVAFAKPSGRIRGVAELRIVIDNVTTEDNVVYPLSSTLQDSPGTDCAKGKPDEEGKISGCGKTTKDALKAAAIGGGLGALGGASVGAVSRGGCDYYGRCYPSSGPGMGADIGYGAGIGAGTALIYTLLKHEKHIVLAPGLELTFMVNRTTPADAPSPATPSPAQ